MAWELLKWFINTVTMVVEDRLSDLSEKTVQAIHQIVDNNNYEALKSWKLGKFRSDLL